MTEEEQVSYIKSHPLMGTLKISHELKISNRKVCKLIKEHGIVRTMSRRWIKEDDDFLIANFKTMSQQQLAKELDRTYKSINKRAHELSCTRKERPIVNVSDYDKMLGNKRGAVMVAPGHTVYRMGW